MYSVQVINSQMCAYTGVAAGFNAPISGVFFAVETVLQAQGSDLRRNSGDTTPGLTIAMVLLASVLAAIVSQAGLGQAPAVRVPDYQLQSILELPLILAFGACCGAVSASFAYSNQVLPLAAGLSVLFDFIITMFMQLVLYGNEAFNIFHCPAVSHVSALHLVARLCSADEHQAPDSASLS